MRKKNLLSKCAAALLSGAIILTGCGAQNDAAIQSEENAAVEETAAEESVVEDVKSDDVGDILRVIEINMGNDKTVTDAMYNEYFAQNDALAGVQDVIASGNFYINGFAIPGSAEALDSDYPDGYLLNLSPWLVKSDTGYQVDRNDYESYDEAALAAATGFDAGLEVRLYDTDADGYTDRIDMDYVEAVIVAEIIENDDGTYQIRRAEVAPEYAWENDGTIFDGDHFTATSDEVFNAQNFDSTIQEGDIALFWYEPDGWAIERGLEINGILVDGADHEYYQIDDVKYDDAMRFSRDNIIISNRCGEYTNVHKYFGLMNDDKKVSLWFVPTSDPDLMAAPAGFTSGENAKAFLEAAIDVAKEKLDAVVVSKDGSDVTDGKDWVTQEVYDELSDAIERAENAAAEEKLSEVLDYHTYLLYFALNGTNEDIGAQFAGFQYAGFDHQLNGAVVTFENPFSDMGQDNGQGE